MRTCRHTTRPCESPHLACRSCPVQEAAERGLRKALVRRGVWFKPKVLPHAAVLDFGRRGRAVVIGIEGEF